jgi:hypothetical protein
MRIVLLILLAASISQAGIRDVGNAGGGVLVNGKPHLLDLYEAGVTEAAIDQSVTPDPLYLEKLTSMAILTSTEKTLFAQKLTEIRKYSPVTADLIVLGLDKYVWRLFEGVFVEIPEVSPIDLTGVTTVQLANRLGGTIRISKKYWDMMDTGHKVALLVHEILYAYEKPVETKPGSSLFEQRSGPVREKVGYIFSPEFKTRGAQGFTSITGLKKQLSAIHSANSLEVLTTDIHAGFSNLAFSLYVALEDTYKSSEIFCGNIQREMRAKRVSNAVGAASIGTFELSVILLDYQTASGPQKWLQTIESPFILKSYELGEVKFQSGDYNTCVKWVETQRTKVRTWQGF